MTEAEEVVKALEILPAPTRTICELCWGKGFASLNPIRLARRCCRCNGEGWLTDFRQALSRTGG